METEDKYVIILAILIQFIACFLGSMITIAIKQIQFEFSLSYIEVNLLSIVYYIVMISISLPLSKIISKYGIKKFLKFNMILLILGLVMAGLSVNGLMLIFSRIIQGVCFAGLAVSVYVIVVKQIPEDNLGNVLGLVGSAGYIGMTSAPSISGLIITFLDWRYIFYFITIICIITLWMTTKIKTEWINEEVTINHTESILYMVSMILFIAGCFNLNNIMGILTLILSIILFSIFIKFERKNKNPIINLNLFKNIEFDIGNYAAFSTHYITYVLGHILTLHLLFVANIGEFLVGNIMLIPPIIMIIISPISGKLTNRFDTRFLSANATTLLLIVLIILIFIRVLPFELIILAMMLQGLGQGLFSPPNNKNVLTLVDENDDLTNASALLSTSKDLGKTISIGTYNVICAIIGLNFNEVSQVAGKLIEVNEITIFIAMFIAISSITLLLYSKYKFNEPIIDSLKFLKGIPKKLKKQLYDFHKE